MKTAHRILSEVLSEEEFYKWSKLVTPQGIADFYKFVEGVDRDAPQVVLTFTLPVGEFTSEDLTYWISVKERIMGKPVKNEVEIPDNIVYLKARTTKAVPAFAPLVADTMSHADKLHRLEDGRYWCQVPPVLTSEWNAADWVRHIDNTGGWKK